MTKKKETKKIGVGLIFSWIFGILFLLLAIGSIFSGEFFSGIVLFVMAGAILPTANKLLKEKQSIELSRGLKITIIIIGLIIIGIASGSSNIDSTNNYENNIQSENAKAPSSAEEPKATIEPEPEITTAPTQTTTPAVEEQSDKATMGEKNALSKALSYLRYTAFSYSGLVTQLEFEGFAHQEAVYGVDNCGADWNEQAALKAQSYLDYSAFSREGLINQLEFEGFTKEQAEYGVQAVGY